MKPEVYVAELPQVQLYSDAEGRIVPEKRNVSTSFKMQSLAKFSLPKFSHHGI